MRDSVVYWVLGIVYCYMGNYNSNCQFERSKKVMREGVHT